MNVNHAYNLEKWKLLIQDQIHSGMKVIDWCRENGYTKHAYYYWSKKVRQECLPAALDQLHGHNQTPALVDVTPITTGNSHELRADSSHYSNTPSAIIRKNGFEIEVFNSVSTDLVQHLIEGMMDA